MQKEEFSLDREQNIQNYVDAQGKKWEIHIQRGTHLCYAWPKDGREDSVIPNELEGKWTKVGLLQQKIEDYVTKTWDKLEQDALAKAREIQALNEAEAYERKVAAAAKKAQEEADAKVESEQSSREAVPESAGADEEVNDNNAQEAEARKEEPKEKVTKKKAKKKVAKKDS